MTARCSAFWLVGHGIHPVHQAGLAIFVAVVAMSALVAKSFCSHLCPIGTVSEALGRAVARLLGRCWPPPRWLDVPLRGLKYVLLVFFGWATWVALNVAGVRAFLDSPCNRVADTKMLLFFAYPSRLTQAVLGVLAVGIYLGVTSVFRLGGHWRGSVSEEEYARRLREIDTPLYTHVGGMPSAETGRNDGAPVRRNGAR